ncbi:MAG TPA: hypothetical protein VKG25_06680 [Bryobacteraceae bacterium]|nr:hypothetical protein [Bryobacteraceae bacterium]
MSKRALTFASIVALAGAGVVASASVTWTNVATLSFLVCAALALLAATFKVRVPGMVSAISPVAVPILFAGGTIGWQAAALIAAVTGILQSVWRPKVKPMPIQIVFNGATIAIAATLGTQVANLVTARGSFVWFIAAAVVFQVSNAILVSGVLSLLGDSVSLVSLWRNCHLWSFPYQLTAGLFAGLWAQAGPLTASNVAPFSAVALAGAVLYLMNVFYGEIVQRSGGQAELSTQ